MTSNASEMTDQLEKLASLHGSGALSDAEFEAAKARVLGLTPVGTNQVDGRGSDHQAQVATTPMPSKERACGRAGCSLQGVWTEAEVCEVCGFPTRQGDDAQYAAEKRRMLSTASRGLEPGELPTSYGFVLREGVSSHPDCAKVAACTAVSPIHLLLPNGASGTLTCGTEGIAFWTDDGLSFRWPYKQVVSITIGPGGNKRTDGVSGLRPGGLGPNLVLGPLLTSFLNTVTTKTIVYSLISLVMRDSSVMFRAAVPQHILELELAPALKRIAARS